jgi:hypothetical protein
MPPSFATSLAEPGLTLPVIVNSEMVRTPQPQEARCPGAGERPVSTPIRPRSPQRCAAHPRDRGLAIARRGRDRQDRDGGPRR